MILFRSNSVWVGVKLRELSNGQIYALVPVLKIPFWVLQTSWSIRPNPEDRIMFLCLKTKNCLERLKKRISTSFWVHAAPKAGWNAQQTKFESFFCFVEIYDLFELSCKVFVTSYISYICKFFFFRNLSNRFSEAVVWHSQQWRRSLRAHHHHPANADGQRRQQKALLQLKPEAATETGSQLSNQLTISVLRLHSRDAYFFTHTPALHWW